MATYAVNTDAVAHAEVELAAHDLLQRLDQMAGIG